MKRVILTLAILGIASVAYAQQVLVASPAAGGISLLLTNNAKIQSVTVAGSAGATTLVELFDNDVTNAASYYGTGYLQGAYTGYVWSSSNVVNNYTNLLGTTNLMTNTVWYPVASNYPAWTNPLPVNVAVAVPISQTINYPVDKVFAKGVVMRVNTNATVIINYKLQ